MQQRDAQGAAIRFWCPCNSWASHTLDVKARRQVCHYNLCPAAGSMYLVALQVTLPKRDHLIKPARVPAQGNGLRGARSSARAHLTALVGDGCHIVGAPGLLLIGKRAKIQACLAVVDGCLRATPSPQCTKPFLSAMHPRALTLMLGFECYLLLVDRYGHNGNLSTAHLRAMCIGRNVK